MFAFVVAAGASFLLYRLMASRVSAKAAPTTTKVVVAARTLELGTVLQDSDLSLADWPGSLPPGASASKKDLVGRGVISTVYANEPVLETRLAAKGAGGGLAAMIPAGMRAVAVRVNEVVGVAGFVVPGSRVDVLISGNPPAQVSHGLGSVTKTILQNIEVLSAGQDFKKDAEGKPVTVQVINLLVNPEQAEILSLAMNQASIQLVLRNPLDRDVAKTSGTAMAQLFTGAIRPPVVERPVVVRPKPVVAQVPPPQAAPPPKPPPFVMEIIQGTKKTESKFETEAR
ncbi:MAG: Flp pilus assembly protein CpaB [Bryobacteraceae bacterium]